MNSVAIISLFIGPYFKFAIPRVGTAGIVSSLPQLITIKTITLGGLNVPQINSRYETLLTVEHPPTTVIQTDIFYTQPPPIPFSSLSVDHMSLSVGQYDFLQITMALNSALIGQWASTASSPSIEMILYLEFENTQFDYALGMTTSGSLKYSYSSALSSGDQCDVIIQTSSSTLSTNANFLMGDSTVNPRIMVPVHDLFSSTTYTITVPMILNPAALNNPLNMKIWAVRFEANQAFPVVLFYYSLRNHAFTTAASVSSASITLTTSTESIQTTGNVMGFQITSPTSSMVASSHDRWAIRILDGYKSSSFSYLAVSICKVLYFPITSFYLIQPTSSSTAQTALSLSGLSILDYVSSASVESLLFISSATFASGSQSTVMTSSVLSINPGTTFSLVEGLTNYKSEGLYSLTFTKNPLTIPSLGYFDITIPSTFSPISNFGLGDYCQVLSPTNEATNVDGTNNVIYCYQVSSTVYRIQGFGAQGVSVFLSLKLYLKVAATSGSLTFSSLWIYGILGNSVSKIIEGTFAPTSSVSTVSYLTSLSITNNFPQYVYANEWGNLEFNFKATTTGGLQFANSAELLLTLPTGFVLASGGSTKVYARYGPSSGISYVTLTPTVSGQLITIPIQQGYDIPANVDYTLIIDTVLSATNNGVQRPDPTLYTFILEWQDTVTLK